jgi:UDP-3-O-[3-hydroxymyristoyl] glucosamine N-acyltransferase
MATAVTYTLAQLAERVGGRAAGDPECLIHGVGSLGSAGEGKITFLVDKRYRGRMQESAATAIILSESELPHCPTNALVVQNPYAAYARISTLFDLREAAVTGIHPSAVVSPEASVDPSASIGANSVIGPRSIIGPKVEIGPGCHVAHDVEIGEATCLMANVSVYHGCRVGARVIVHAGVVIGSDGFGFAEEDGKWVKIAQLGGVRIGDDVEIGANTTIDRGAIDDTVIEDGVKLDNLIQVAHNVRIGAGTAMAGCVGIAGSADIGERCRIGGGVGILGHLKIVDDVTVTAMSLVPQSIREPGVYSAGTPLERNDQWHKNFIRFKQLDEMARRLKRLEKELKRLQEGQDH